MKKIALLFTILCAGQLYGMEQPEKGLLEVERISDLPLELQNVINTMALGDSLEEAVKAINVASKRGVRYDTLKDFTRLVHILADKFNISTEKVALKIVLKLKMPTANKYLSLINDANSSLSRVTLNKLEQLIINGLDVNATFDHGNHSLLQEMLRNEKPLELIKLLLDAGANPHYKDDDGKTALDIAQQSDAHEEVITLLKEAMKKQPPK